MHSTWNHTNILIHKCSVGFCSSEAACSHNLWPVCSYWKNSSTFQGPWNSNSKTFKDQPCLKDFQGVEFGESSITWKFQNFQGCVGTMYYWGNLLMLPCWKQSKAVHILFLSKLGNKTLTEFTVIKQSNRLTLSDSDNCDIQAHNHKNKL